MPVNLPHQSDAIGRRSAHPLRPQTGIAWLVIVLTVLALLIVPRLLPSPAAEQASDRISIAMMRMQAMYLVGVADARMAPAPMLLDQAATTLNTGSIDQRAAYVILAGELGGAQAAADALADVHDDMADAPSPERITEAHERLIEVVNRLYVNSRVTESAFVPVDDRAAAVEQLTADERDLLVDRLGWFGQLALHPEGGPDTSARNDLMRSARQAAFTLIGFAVTVGLAGFVGLVLLILAVVFIVRRSVRWRFAAPGGHHGVYAETFAVWLLLFIGLQFLPLHAAVMFFGSLAALAWPVVRGVTWSQVRADIGLTGSGSTVHALVAVPVYLATLPVVGIGLLMTLVLMAIAELAAGPAELFEPNAGPAHPVIDAVASGTAWQVAGIFVLAAVAAPIVEEIMFRGVLYAHLRGATKQTQQFASVVLSTGLNTYIFAVIHPQGVVAVPVLMALAAGFTIAREWRGSVVTPIVMHGLSNGIVITFMTLMMRA